MTNLIQIPRGDIYQGEVFDYYYETADRRAYFNTSGTCGCFGAFTHSGSSKNTLFKHARFTYYFTFKPSSVPLDELKDYHVLPEGKCIPFNNALVIADSFNDIDNEIHWLKNELKAYFPNFSVYLDRGTKDWKHGNFIHHKTNAQLHFSFQDMYMWEMFLVLQCFRQYCQLTSNFSYQIAKRLYLENWYQLSFVQILLMTHLLPLDIPNDQKIGKELASKNRTEWITVDTIRENHEKFASHVPTHANLSALTLPCSTFPNKEYNFFDRKLIDIPKEMDCSTHYPNFDWTIVSMERCYEFLKV